MNRLYWSFTFLFCVFTLGVLIAIPENIILNLSLMGIGLSLIAGKLFWGRAEAKKLLSEIKLKSLLSYSLSVFLLLGIWGLLNYMGVKIQKSWSLSPDQKSLDLSEQSRVLLEGIEQKTEILLLAPRPSWESYLPMLRRVREVQPLISIEAFDLDLNPLMIEQYKLEKKEALIIKRGEKKVTSYFWPERSQEEVLVNALLKFSLDKPKLILFSQGHGEFSIYDRGNQGLSYFKDRLTEQNFMVQGVDLSKEKISEKASLLVIWGKKRPFTGEEIDQIQNFLNGGGQILMAQGPYFKKGRDLGLEKVLEDWDILFQNQMVLDKTSSAEGMEASIVQVKKYNKSHPVLKDFKGVLYFPLASSLKVGQNQKDKRAMLMFESEVFPATWAERDLESLMKGRASFDQGDEKGPIGLGLSSQKVTHPFGGIVLLASSSFALNHYSAQVNHYQLLLNTVSWQLGLENLILKERVALKRAPIILSQKHLYLIFYFSVLLLPILSSGLALALFFRKRRG